MRARSLRSRQEAALSWCPDRRGEAGETSTLRACDHDCLLVRPSMVDLCPPCSVCEGVNAVATFVDQLALLPGLAGEVGEQLQLRRLPNRVGVPHPSPGIEPRGVSSSSWSAMTSC